MTWWDQYLLHSQFASESRSEPVRIIWMFWKQGLTNLEDPYNKRCINAWIKLNPDWNVRVLDEQSALNYVPEMAHYTHLTVQLQSDVLRVFLLKRYGGVWADVSTLPMKRLTGTIENIDNGTGVFFYRFFDRPGHPSHIGSSWFLVAKEPGNYFMTALKQKFCSKMLEKREYEYFVFHDTMGELYQEDEQFKAIADKLTLTPDLPHAPLQGNPYPMVDIAYKDDHPLVYKRAKVISEDAYKTYIEQYINQQKMTTWLI